MPKVPVYKLPEFYKKPAKAKKNNWKVMNREVKPRETEIVNRLNDIVVQMKVLKIESRRLNDELKVVRGISTFGKNYVKLYALRLQNECWYVGMTYDVDRRFKKHSRGKGAQWTKLYNPIEVFETRETTTYSQDEAAKLEDDMTLEYVLKYGSDKVRGGGYCQMKPIWPALVIENEAIKLG